jgi:hypothetical protein
MEIMFMEEWKEISGWPKYHVSNLGRVKRIKSQDAKNRYWIEERILKPVPTKNSASGKYKPLFVSLSDSEKRKIEYKIAYLVLSTFKGNPPSKLENCVRHLDDNQENNALTNLSWGSQKENGEDRIKNGKTLKGSKNPKSVTNEEIAKQLRKEYIKSSRIHGTVALGKKYNLDHAVVWNIVNNKTYKE